MDTSFKNENDLIRKYREIAFNTECDSAIEEIVNEAICHNEKGEIVQLDLEELKVSDSIKKKITAEFEEVLNLLDFENKAHDLFRSWYVDGRQYQLVNIDADSPKDGIKRIEQVDARKIRKIKKINKRKDPATGVDLIDTVEEFFVYNDKGVDGNSTTGIKLSLDSVVFITSGAYDQNNMMVLSHLHKALKPANQLKMLEDSVVIYRLVRAPERRIFYIDVGNLPKAKADQYVTDIMNRYKNKIVYDANTGEVKDDRKHMSMLEDFWMPRREGGKGTEITTLPGGQSLANMEDVDYFKQKLYQSLNVPISRLIPNQNFTLGRSNEITRDELKFNKFVSRLRNKFGSLLIQCLKLQLIAKNIVSADDWQQFEREISLKFIEDNNFVELKEAELLNNRLAQLQIVDQFAGKYFSQEWIKKNVLKMNDEEIKEIGGQMQDEAPVEPEQTEDSDAEQSTQQPAAQPLPKLEQVEQQTSNELSAADELAVEKSLAELRLYETVEQYFKGG